MTFEGAVPAEHEIYFLIIDSTHYRAPTITLSHCGGVDIEELSEDKIIEVPFDPLTGLKSFVSANALSDLRAPREIVSPLVQNLPRLWDLFHYNGMTTLELNPIRMSPVRTGALSPVACDFKCGFDRDDPRVARAFYGELVQTLHDEGATKNVFCVNVDAVISALLLKPMWPRYRSGDLNGNALQDAAFTAFLFGRMAGCAGGSMIISTVAATWIRVRQPQCAVLFPEPVNRVGFGEPRTVS